MPSTREFRRPLYAAAGAGEYAVERLRTEYRKLHEQAKAVDVESVRSVQHRVEEYANKYTGKYTKRYAERASDVYDDLVARGEKLVERVRSRPATQQFMTQLSFTRRNAKATATTAKAGAEQTRRQAKATTTSARKAGSAAIKAVEDATDKTG